MHNRKVFTLKLFSKYESHELPTKGNGLLIASKVFDRVYSRKLQIIPCAFVLKLAYLYLRKRNRQDKKLREGKVVKSKKLAKEKVIV